MLAPLAGLGCVACVACVVNPRRCQVAQTTTHISLQIWWAAGICAQASPGYLRFFGLCSLSALHRSSSSQPRGVIWLGLTSNWQSRSPAPPRRPRYLPRPDDSSSFFFFFFPRRMCKLPASSHRVHEVEHPMAGDAGRAEAGRGGHRPAHRPRAPSVRPARPSPSGPRGGPGRPGPSRLRSSAVGQWTHWGRRGAAWRPAPRLLGRGKGPWLGPWAPTGPCDGRGGAGPRWRRPSR